MVDFSLDTLRYRARERYTSGWSGLLLQLWFDDAIRVSPGDGGMTKADTVFREYGNAYAGARGVWSW